jgi:hypothetical protein
MSGSLAPDMVSGMAPVDRVWIVCGLWLARSVSSAVFAEILEMCESSEERPACVAVRRIVSPAERVSTP